MTDEQKEHVRLWVAALRSGEFKQGRDMLRSNNAYCCLGVACEIYRRETQNAEWRGSMFVAGAAGRSSTALPKLVVDWLGVESGSPRVRTEVSFIDMNDGDRADFATIADAIEQTYLEVPA